MAPGTRSKFGAPMFEPEVFRKQKYFTEESTCDIVDIFRRPSHWFCAPIMIRRPGACAPFTPSRYSHVCTVMLCSTKCKGLRRTWKSWKVGKMGRSWRATLGNSSVDLFWTRIVFPFFFTWHKISTPSLPFLVNFSTEENHNSCVDCTKWHLCFDRAIVPVPFWEL